MVTRFNKPGSKPFHGRWSNYGFKDYLHIGEVSRVDYVRGLVDIQWVQNKSMGAITNVRLPAAFSSKRGTLIGMPEVGSLVVCSWTQSEEKMQQPIILGFLETNLENALEYKLSRGKSPDNLEQITKIKDKIGYDIIRSKRKKTYPGEIHAESTQGAELHLSEDIYLSDNRLSEIEIVSADQSIRFSSLQQYSSTEASRLWNGMITREPISDESTFIQPTYLPNGKEVTILTDSLNPYHLGGKPFTEYRIEAYEKGDGILNVNEVNSGLDLNQNNPFVTLVLGTNVGNNQNDLNRYGKVLRPQIFGNLTDSEPIVNDLECMPEEYESLASAFQLNFRSGTKIDIDKQGHLFSNFSASTGQYPLGEGISWESNYDGMIRWLIGKDTNNGNSFIIDTKGSIKESLGTENLKGRSKETYAQGSIYTEILNSDEDGNSYILISTGNVLRNTTGNETLNVGTDYFINVDGKIDEEILGAKVENYGKDHNTVVGGSRKENVVKDKQVTIGENREVTINGTKNGIPTSPSTTVDSLEITTGTLEIKTLLGNIKINSLTQQVEINGSLKVTLKSGVKIEALAPQVAIGQLPNRGGVVTGTPGVPSHYDYITGSPLVGSGSVKATSF